jgi:hypothetical protein
LKKCETVFGESSASIPFHVYILHYYWSNNYNTFFFVLKPKTKQNSRDNVALIKPFDSWIMPSHYVYDDIVVFCVTKIKYIMYIARL